MKVLTIVGARPQFIKSAVVSRQLRKNNEEIIVHTGQHYDYNMSDVFFDELKIPRPDYNLGISGGTHGKMTGEMLIEIEKVLLIERPDMVLIYGDTNSTLAGALASVKLHIPICHVEAGVRFGTLTNPEEINRIVSDDVSAILMCCTESAVRNLSLEGKTENVFLVGDPMYDAFNFYVDKIGSKAPEKIIGLDGEEIFFPDKFYYMTCHREENAGSDEPLTEILYAMNSLKFPCVYPVHPRNKERVIQLKQKYNFKNIIACQPVGYLMSIYLTVNAEKILTDSGGLQREAFFAKKQCITIFDYIVWPETMIDNRNQLCKPCRKEIVSKINTEQSLTCALMPFGDGKAACKIAELISKFDR
ncbi:MAG: UDP-N-acetylglucosamine 2-epimerase (non-hydrolyzing) [Clostridiales bacterium]|nr:UDP-N-acetylglucosamine 2-epimerase (non-hydrolyzing) [Clostridiales bacterium]